MLVAETEEKKQEKERVVNECYPPLKLSGLSVQELQVLTQHITPIQLSMFRTKLTGVLYRTCVKTSIKKLMLWMKHVTIWRLRWPKMRRR